MSVLRTWQGTARKTSKVQTITVGSNTNGHIFTIKLEHPSGSPGDAVTIISYTAGAAETTTTIANAISYLLRTGSTSGSSGTGTGTATGYQHEYALDVTWGTNSSAVITATANTPGRPFLITTAGTGTLTVATTTANSGPNDWSVAGNWLEGVVPVADDDVIITASPRGSSDILYGLNQYTITLDTIQIINYKGKVGSPSAPLCIAPSDEVIINSPGCEFHMRGDGGGSLVLLQVVDCLDSSFAKLSSGSGYTITSAQVFGGSCTVGFDRSSAPTLTNAFVIGGSFKTYRSNILTNLYQTGGSSYLYTSAGNITLIQIDDGVCTLDYGAGADTITQNGGTVNYDAVGATVTTWTLNGGLADTTRTRKGTKTISTLTHAQAGRFRFDTAYTTVTTWTRNGPFETFGIGNNLRTA